MTFSKTSVCKIVSTICLMFFTVVFVRLSSKSVSSYEACKKNSRIIHANPEYQQANISLIDENCKNKTCLRKCCPEGQILDRHLNTLDDYYSSGKLYSAPISCEKNENNSIAEFELIDSITRNNYTVIYGFPCVNKFHDITSYLFEMATKAVGFSRLDSSSYCFDLSYDLITDYSSNHDWYEKEVLCLMKLQCKPVFITYVRDSILLSTISFFITFVVYAALPQLKKTTHCLCLMSHTASLFFAYLIIIFKKSFVTYCESEKIDGEIRTISNKVKSFFLHNLYFIFYYAGFFWMNVICFDIWRNLRSMKSVSDPDKKKEKRKFLKYSIYCWCTPILFFILNIIFLILNSDSKRDLVEFENCFITGSEESQCTFFYVPLSIILMINMFFFIDTLYRMKKTWKETDLTLRNTRNNSIVENLRERLSVCGKLFVIMGVPYILELMSFLFAKELQGNYWYIADIARSIQGILVLISFIIRKQVLKALYDNYCPFIIQDINFPNCLMGRSSLSCNNNITTAVKKDGVQVVTQKLESDKYVETQC